MIPRGAAVAKGDHVRKNLVVALLAAALSLGINAALPLSWESTAVLLPSDRRTDEFHYRNTRAGLSRFLESFRLVDRSHPEEIDRAILTGAESARRLVERLDLQRRWKAKTLEDATVRLSNALEVELVPYGPMLVKARTEDRRLSADLANEAALVLEERLDELHLAMVESERGFLTDAIRDELAEALMDEARLAEFETLYGLVDADAERREESAWAVERASALASARVRAAEAARRFGVGSAQAQDEHHRAEVLRSAEAGIPSSAATRTHQDRLEADVRRAERIARLLGALRGQTWTQEARRMGDFRRLDDARPAELPILRPFVLAAFLAAAFAPLATFAVRAAPPRFHVPLAALVPLVATLAVVVTRAPILLAGVLMVGFLATLVVRVPAGWFVLVAALPWAWEYVDRQRGFQLQIPTEPGIIALVGAWLYALALRGGANIPRSRILVAATLVIAWTAFTSLTTIHPKYSIFQIVSVGGFVLAGVLFPIFEIRDVRIVRHVLYATIASGAALALVGIVQVTTSPLAFDRAAYFMGSQFLWDHGPYTAFLGFPLGAALVLLVWRAPGEKAWPFVLAIGMILVAILISLARAAWIAAVVLFAIAAIVRGRVFARTMLPALVALGLLVGLVLGVTAAAPVLRAYVTKTTDLRYASNVERINRWRAGIAMIRDRPLTGVGPGAYEMAYPAYRDAAFVTAQSDERMGAHSDLVRAGAEQGIVGLAVLLFLVVTTYATAIRLVRHGHDPEIGRLALALAAGLFTYTIHGLFNEYWRITKVAFLIWVFVGLLGALEQIHLARAGRHPIPSRRPPEDGLSAEGSRA